MWYMKRLTKDKAAKVLRQLLDQPVVLYADNVGVVKALNPQGIQLLIKRDGSWTYLISEEFLFQDISSWSEILPVEWKTIQQWNPIEYMAMSDVPDYACYSNDEPWGREADPPVDDIFNSLGLDIPRAIKIEHLYRELIAEGFTINLNKHMLNWYAISKETRVPCADRKGWLKTKFIKDKGGLK